VRTKLAAARGYLAVAPKVVNVARDVKMPAFDPRLPTDGPHDPDRLITLAEQHNVAGPVRRLVDAITDTR
jgi:hypothetical protein